MSLPDADESLMQSVIDTPLARSREDARDETHAALQQAVDEVENAMAALDASLSRCREALARYAVLRALENSDNNGCSSLSILVEMASNDRGLGVR